MPSNKEIINRNLTLLTEKGYFYGGQMYLNRLERFKSWFEISLRICQSKNKISEEPIEFAMPVTELFRKDKDAIYFDLIYEYHPKLYDAVLKSISASIWNSSKTYNIKAVPGDIPNAMDIYTVLLDDVLNRPSLEEDKNRRDELHKLSIENQKAINAICKEQREMLTEKGYLITPFRQGPEPDNFTKALQEKLATLVNHPAARPSFIGLRTSRYFNNETSKTTFRFIYSFHLDPLKVQLKSIHGKMGQWESLRLVTGPKDLPDAMQLHQSMAARKLFSDARQRFRKIFKTKSRKY